MGTWSQPNTVEKARILSRLLAKPLSAKKAERELFHLMGSDFLFDALYELDDDEDARAIVRYHLKLTLDNLQTSRIKWDDKTLDILTELI